jgi:hypothetical protein
MLQWSVTLMRRLSCVRWNVSMSGGEAAMASRA